ncbi:hypothetical protein AX17_003310 [Amanita inopinata Kibby_2008]|nr:hypothetical protein AX17_003310 [Amanita inopinata Kibby_2008]
MSTQAGTSPATGRGPQTFEFTKRKRWADLLITELADVIILILSPSRAILFCGNAVTELLGWHVEDILDRDLLNLIPSTDDQFSFCSAFQHSINANVELLVYLRLKANSSKDILFELKGYPHLVNDNECKCFFVMARPYPSRNTAMLNTFLELKIENERLQQRVAELKSLLPLHSGSSSTSSSNGSAYATSTMQQQRLLSTSGPHQKSLNTSAIYFASSATSCDESLPGMRNSCELPCYGSGLYATSAHPDEDAEDGLRKKKLKKSHLTEQYVCITCGRTDSPEWRKGPLGPKTLCNACGLRWAKQMRKYDDPVEGSSSSCEATLSLPASTSS